MVQTAAVTDSAGDLQAAGQGMEIFYVLKKTGGIKAPNPPRFKQDNIPVTYMQMGIRHEKGSDQLRLSLPKDLKSYMEETYGIHEKFLYLENKIFRNMARIKQLRIYPPKTESATLLSFMRLKSRNSILRMDIIYLLILGFII